MTLRRTSLAGCIAIAALSPAAVEPSLKEVVHRLSTYVSSYGEQASIIVATERYSQEYVSTQHGGKRQVSVADFAIVKSEGVGWIGYRDVIEVDGKRVSDREDRLVSLLTSASGRAADARRLSDESARFNIGPTLRNYNVPTTALFFFATGNADRFSFKRKNGDHGAVWEIAFKETGRPTFIHTPDRRSIPTEGSLWVNPDDGRVLRSQLKMTVYANASDASSRTSAVVDVVYREVEALGMWLPSTMTEVYDGTNGLTNDHITTRAEYSNYRQFQTSGRVKSIKK
jgi:hypothetical protein